MPGARGGVFIAGVMEPDRVVHQPDAFLYRSTLADLVDGLRLRLDHLKQERDSRDKDEEPPGPRRPARGLFHKGILGNCS